MRAIYMGKSKPSTIEGLEYLIEKGVDVVAVVAPPRVQPDLGIRQLVNAAHCFGIPTATDNELYYRLSRKKGIPQCGYVLENIDLVISFLFWKKIRKPLIDLPKIGCVNLHPAPLPDFRGVGGYNFAIYENLSVWGVSAHFVDESFDSGDIIKVHRFKIDPRHETAFSLEQKSQCLLLDLFKEVVDIALDTSSLPRSPQGEGRYVTNDDFEELRKIHPDDTLEEVERKIRAFWYPPYAGASIEIQGTEFTVVSKELLKEISKMYHGGWTEVDPIVRARAKLIKSGVKKMKNKL